MLVYHPKGVAEFVQDYAGEPLLRSPVVDSEIHGRSVWPNVGRGIANAGPVSTLFDKADTNVGPRTIAKIKLDVRILRPLERVLFDLMSE